MCICTCCILYVTVVYMSVYVIINDSDILIYVNGYVVDILKELGSC